MCCEGLKGFLVWVQVGGGVGAGGEGVCPESPWPEGS